MTAPTAAHGVQVSVDCADPAAMTRFWSLALGYLEQPPPEGSDDWTAFADAVGRLIDAGAELVEEREDSESWWIVLHDIEGNEFCLQ